MTVAQITTNPTNLDVIDKINEIIRNLLYVDDSTVKIGGGGVISAAPPVGAVYVQFPGESAPADIYGGEWTNISAQFAGQFFRAEGGNAAAFGSSQNGGAPNITGSFTVCSMWGQGPTGAFYNASQATRTGISGGADSQGTNYGFSAYNSHSGYGLGEFRPYNSTIRIWRKTA
ncbi:hypothetical protein NAI82_09500 [Oxalobacter sp. JAC-2022]|uniref:hypothetical protein n=1 Tax=Oxalobacter aliiformigenes TaxID=2946593 RepID=UPI0022B014CE|nr:hypothetical protein [Oxalobacter aliiformigenes]MCZ4065657.1 hypothetical protein [Oxalobacter aliiformigenes]